MSRPRYIRLEELLPRTKGHCRWCHGKLTGKKLWWCSKECVKQGLARCHPSAMRGLVFERDRGICSNCGIDTERLRRVFKAARDYQDLSHRKQLNQVVRRLGYRVTGYYDAIVLWEADHIVPHAAGGALILENMRTLCVPCHKERTRQQRKGVQSVKSKESIAVSIQLLPFSAQSEPANDQL